MTISREAFVKAVNGCVGTPVRHMGRCIGAALDCVGVPIAALRLCGVALPEPPPYANPPGSGALYAALEQHCDRVEIGDRQPGDLIVVLWKGEPRHVMVHVGHDHDGRVLAVHARARSGVVACEPVTRGYRIASCWKFKEVG